MRSRLMQYRSGPLMQNHSGVDTQLQFLANAFHSGQSPFWNPSTFVGVPQIADPQSLTLLACGPARLSREGSELLAARCICPGTARPWRCSRPETLPGQGLAPRGRHRRRHRVCLRRVGGLAHPAYRADPEPGLLRRHAVAACAGARPIVRALRRAGRARRWTDGGGAQPGRVPRLLRSGSAIALDHWLVWPPIARSRRAQEPPCRWCRAGWLLPRSPRCPCS